MHNDQGDIVGSGVLPDGDQRIFLLIPNQSMPLPRVSTPACALAGLLERPELVQRIAAVIRAAATEPEVARLLREVFPGQLLDALQGLPRPWRSRLRLNLFG